MCGCADNATIYRIRGLFTVPERADCLQPLYCLDVRSWTVIRNGSVLLRSGFPILSALVIRAFMMMSTSYRTLRTRSMSYCVPVHASADSLSLYTMKFSILFFYLPRLSKVLSNHILNICCISHFCVPDRRSHFIWTSSTICLFSVGRMAANSSLTATVMVAFTIVSVADISDCALVNCSVVVVYPLP